MREIRVTEVTALVKELCIKANIELTPDICAAIEKGRAEEKSPVGQEIFLKMEENFRLARENAVPVCQDTGMAVIFMEIGQDVHLTGGLLEDAVNEGVRQGYVEGYLRCSVVKDPLRRENTQDNTPAVLYVSLTEGDKIHITVAPKGFGSENMSAMRMFTPAATEEDILSFIVGAVEKAGSNPCPPVMVGVGLGGTSDKAAYLAKRALLRPAGQWSGDAFYQRLEQEALRRINKLGIGPQGLGGTVTALHVAMEPFPTHIAGLPCVVNIGCHVTRHAGGTI